MNPNTPKLTAQVKAENKVIWTNHRAYTEAECRETGYNQGRDGIRYYPCTVWDMTEGDQVRGNKNLARRVYDEGYKAGRLAWKEFTGKFPETGSNHLDSP